MVREFTEEDYASGNGMLTSAWGPAMWHVLHTMSFNYPVKPTSADRKNYVGLLKSLCHTLPCGHCRTNLKKNLVTLPPTKDRLASRAAFSRYIYDLHQLVNDMLHKPKHTLTYENVRDRYERLRARCTPASLPSHKSKHNSPNLFNSSSRTRHAQKTSNGKKTKHKNTTKSRATHRKESGCTVPMHKGEKARCIIQLVPQQTHGASIQEKT